ncbi:hypothetical protein EAX61_03075 [Dokdonia sinensis]|uniref:Uncharacterized protein n=2 Tax=Dokdonia sinensis TaxID=2479847 RepID=A0A3M0GQD4_9FLAO|nr:hypothetical protein EAX61_03075 [Dokdonia sinensis]
MTGYDSNTYVYKIVDGAGGVPRLLQEIILNPKLSLYMDSKQRFKAKTRTGNPLKIGNVKFVAKTTTIEPTLVPIWFSNIGASDYVTPLPSERDEIIQIFNDCQAVVLKYRNLEDENFYVPEFVRFYNKECY